MKKKPPTKSQVEAMAEHLRERSKRGVFEQTVELIGCGLLNKTGTELSQDDARALAEWHLREVAKAVRRARGGKEIGWVGFVDGKIDMHYGYDDYGEREYVAVYRLRSAARDRYEDVRPVVLVPRKRGSR